MSEQEHIDDLRARMARKLPGYVDEAVEALQVLAGCAQFLGLEDLREGSWAAIKNITDLHKPTDAEAMKP